MALYIAYFGIFMLLYIIYTAKSGPILRPARRFALPKSYGVGFTGFELELELELSPPVGLLLGVSVISPVVT